MEDKEVKQFEGLMAQIESGVILIDEAREADATAFNEAIARAYASLVKARGEE